jgi:hypothetical protein
MNVIHDICLLCLVYDGRNFVYAGQNMDMSHVACLVVPSSLPNAGIGLVAWSFVVIVDTGAIAGECGLRTKHISALMREHPWKLWVLASGLRVQAGAGTVMTMECHAGRVLV